MIVSPARQPEKQEVSNPAWITNIYLHLEREPYPGIPTMRGVIYDPKEKILQRLSKELGKEVSLGPARDFDPKTGKDFADLNGMNNVHGVYNAEGIPE